MIRASELVETIRSIDAAIKFISDTYPLSATKRRIKDDLDSAKHKLVWALSDAKVKIENDTKEVSA